MLIAPEAEQRRTDDGTPLQDVACNLDLLTAG
jgi:hypothetical protein